MDLSKKNNITLIIFAFIISRIIYYKLGIRFETMPHYWQILPLLDLKYNLIDSIQYNFAQPPLLNFLYGISIKFSDPTIKAAYSLQDGYWGGSHNFLLHSVYLIFGLISFVNLYRISIIFFFFFQALIIILILMIMPLTILWENHGYKDYLTMCFLISAIYYSLNLIKKKEYKNYIFLGIYLSLLCLLRETFHIYWAYIFIIFEYFCNKRIKKSFLLFMMISFLVLPFYLKNYFIFGSFQISGWMYENLSQRTLFVNEMKDGKHTKLKKLIFKNDENYNNFTEKLSPLHGNTFIKVKEGYIKILDYKYKYSAGILRSDSYHNEVMLEVEKIRKKDLIVYLKEYPQVFLVGIVNAISRHFFNSSENFIYIRKNVDKIPNLVRLSHCVKLTYLCIGKMDLNSYSYMTYKEKILFTLEQTNFLVLFIYLFTFYQFIKFIFNKKNSSKEDQFIKFWTLTIFFMLSLLVIFEDTEIPRHRFPYDYLMFVFSLYFLKSNKTNKSLVTS